MKRRSTNSWKDFGDEDDHQPHKKKLKNIVETSSESESSDDDAEICAICLGKLYKSQVGSPEGCDHVFCLKCILEWSKNVNTCPVDRQQFQIIFARESIDDNSAVIINVENKDNRVAPEEHDVTLCEICRLGDREDRLLLCDGCNKGYHLECLTPPLNQVPHGDWFCEDCEVNSLGPAHSRSNRMIARTLIYQRVMRNIRQISESSEEDDSEEDDVNDSEEESEEEDISDARQIESNKVHLNVLKKTKNSSPRSKRKKKCSSSKSRSKKRRGSKRRKRRYRRRSKRSLPSLFGESSHSRQSQRYPLEQHSLSIFGNRLHLHNFKDEIPAPSTSRAPKSKESTSTRASKSKEDKKSFDILGDILNGQALLHSKSSDVAINRDGTLKPLKPLPDLRLPTDGKPTSSFFLVDICSSSVASPSISSTSSPRSLSSAQKRYHNSSPYSQFSDFSDSSDDSYPSNQPTASYEESYNSLTNDINKSKDSNEANLRTAKSNFFDKFGEYSPVCEDGDDDDDGGGSGGAKKEPLAMNVDEENVKVKSTESSTKRDLPDQPHKSSGQSLLTTSSPDPEKAAKNLLQAEFKTKCEVDRESKDSNSPELGNSSNSNCSSANGEQESSSRESFGMVLSGRKEEADGGKKDVEDFDPRMDVDSDEEDAVDDEDGKLVTKDGSSSQQIMASKAEERAKRLASIEKVMQDALKSYYVSRKISKDDYKLIMRKGVSKIMKSRDRRIEADKVKKFVDKYVAMILQKKSS